MGHASWELGHLEGEGGEGAREPGLDRFVGLEVVAGGAEGEGRRGGDAERTGGGRGEEGGRGVFFRREDGVCGLLAFGAVEEAEFRGVVRVARGALVAEPVVGDGGFCAAVVALDDGAGVEELLGHGLRFDGEGQLLPLEFHVDGGFLARRTLVGGFHVLVVAFFMEVVAAGHGDDSRGRVEEVLAADGAVAVGGALDTFVRGRKGDGYAHVAVLVHVSLVRSTRVGRCTLQ